MENCLRRNTVLNFFCAFFRCGDSQRYFYMEVGRHSVIGPGELWMETDDPLIAQNMHTTIIAYVNFVFFFCSDVTSPRILSESILPLSEHWEQSIALQ